MKIPTFRATWRASGLLVAMAGLALATGCSYTNGYTEPVTCTTVPATVSYKLDVLPIFKAECFRCHDAAHYQLPAPQGSSGAMNMESFSSISTWTSPKTGINGVSYMVGCIRHDAGFIAMPYDGGKLDACEIATIKAWVDAGAQNN
ncbi:hypothetical protein QMK33_00610 [Hymenobacter sp. H14-R3]|uniref:hypothetical protein n=1 Tax=Hymenobacter sp. H14-R3 TaxID=3046308 RepID=UPI0024BBD8B4|nr:hypothetical protein [Hymenobacter sp. H14-R3]MDJ0363636.1 hypothetical protein [Hymenobacter sp. H14-R3]